MNEINQNNPSAYRHTHSGIDSEKVRITDLQLPTAPTALTPANNGSISFGGSMDLKNTDGDIIYNIRTRVNELETRLRELGLIQ